MSLFKYHQLPNLESYQHPPLGTICFTNLPLNHDIQLLAALEYKGIKDIIILKGEYLEYDETIWSVLGLSCCCPCPAKKLTKAKSGFLVRIPLSIQSSTSTSTSCDNDYKLSYKTWCTLNRPNFIYKQTATGFLFLGFEISIEEYIDDARIIEKSKKMIEQMLELF